MSSPVEVIAGLTVGTVESVAPDEIGVQLDFDAPQATALNTGQPSRFPRINGFVLIPNESGAVVGLVTWLGVERAGRLKQTRSGDFGLVDLPFPIRKITINPVATLRTRSTGPAPVYELARGVAVFPSVGDPVLLPTVDQLRAIVESQGANRRVRIGTSPLAADAVVAVDPDKLFGRHLAVLGNTGSGKSCSVAGLIRWSLEAAKEERQRQGAEGEPNARFIILDPNGEYSKTFSDLGGAVRVFRATFGAQETGEVSLPFTVPAWMWNGHEWSAFAQAAPGVQRPLLLRGLRGLRSGAGAPEDSATSLAQLVAAYKAWLMHILSLGPTSFGQDWRGKQDAGGFLRTLEREMASQTARFPDHAEDVRQIAAAAGALAQERQFDWKGGVAYQAFTDGDFVAVGEALDVLISKLPKVAAPYGPGEDAPVAFDVDTLAEYLDVLSKSEDFSQAAQHVPMLLTRIRTMLGDPRLAPIINPATQLTLAEWLADYLGEDGSDSGQIVVVDLSLVPADVLHLAIAVIGRLVFEASQRYRKLYSRELPTALVLEEAHSFIRRAPAADTGESPAAAVCRETFEKIAREGRKFGLGLVLSSQRPSELSPTVLAQCNTFLLHRIVNDRDQELVSRLVPDKLGALLSELPSLPSRQAILLGWATPVPVLVEILELPPEQRPRSDDPAFWGVWTGADARPVAWGEVAADWTKGPAGPEPAGPEPAGPEEAGS